MDSTCVDILPLLLCTLDPITWPCDNGTVDGVAFTRTFANTNTTYWWPRRKDDGNTYADSGQTQRQLPRGGQPNGHANVDRRVYIIGSGNIGKLLAHSLAGLPNRPPITLLLHQQYLIELWRKEGQGIELITDGVAETRTGYDVELVLPIHHSQTGTTSLSRDSDASEINDGNEDIDPGPLIHNLIVTTKAQHTIFALSAVKDRLTHESTILFLQNGMGVVEEVNEKIFPDIETRPNYVLGITTHGVYPKSSFSAVHAGFGTTALALISRYPLAGPIVPTKQRDWARSSRYLLRTITRTPVLAAVGFSETDMMQLQLEKVAINAIINPLTVMFDCQNGDLLYNYRITRTMRLLLSEISLVVRSLPELEGIPNVKLRFAPDRLENLVVDTAGKTFQNISSMLQDVRNGKETEIDYINGYIVSRGEQMGIKCVMNYMLTQMVKGKQQMAAREIDDYVPFGPTKGIRA